MSWCDGARLLWAAEANLVFPGHRGQVVLEPLALYDEDLFVFFQGSQLLLTGVQLSPQAADLPVAAVQRPLQLTTTNRTSRSSPFTV